MMVLKRRSWLMFSAMIFFSFNEALAQSAPTLEADHVHNKVWVKNLDREILYTFQRYHNTSSDWRDIFPVTTSEGEHLAAIDGVYEVHETSISFTPRFPFAEGVSYVAKFFLDEVVVNYNEVYLPKVPGGTLRLEFSSIQTDHEDPLVTAIYPTTDSLPENLLKFHIAFNTSMQMGELYDRVVLRNGNGEHIEKAFLVIDEELWDNDMKVVTLLLDPGRIKRGLRANLEMGPALRAGENYTLTIEPGWKNIHGLTTKESYQKKFVCLPADRVMPSVDRIEIVSPYVAESAVVLNFHENLDRVLLGEAIHMTDSHGQAIEGKITVMNNERSLAFRPEKKWNAEKYTILINPLLEDLAGNNFSRVFDEDLRSGKGGARSVVSISFTPQLNALAR